MANDPGKDKPFKPETPPKLPLPPLYMTTELARRLEDLTAKFTRSEERTSMLYRDHTLALQQIQQQSAELAELRAEFTAFQNEHCQLREDHAKLQKEHRTLKVNHTSLQTSQGKANQTLAELKLYLDAFQADHSKLLNKQGSLGEGLETLTKDVSSLQIQLQPRLTQFQELRTQQSDLQKETASLKEEVTSQSRDVAGIKDRSSLDAALLQTLQSDLGQLRNDRDAREEEVANLEATLERLRSQVATLEDVQNQQLLLTRDTDAEARSLHTEQEQGPADVDTMYTLNPNTKTVIQETVHEDTVLEDELHYLRKHLNELNSDMNRMKIEMKMMKTSQPDAVEQANSGPRSPDTESGFRENDWPLFKASVLSKRRTKQDQAMIFEMTELNEGGHYDAQTGVFTAPSAGLYCFSLRAGVRDPSDIVHSCLMVGDNQRFKFELLHANRPRWERVCVDLAAGEMVWVKTLSPLGHYDSSHIFHFTGALTRSLSPLLPPPPPPLVFE